MNKKYTKVTNILSPIGIGLNILLIILLLVNLIEFESSLCGIWFFISSILMFSNTPVEWDKALEGKE